MRKLTVISGGTPNNRWFEELVRSQYDILHRVAFRFTRSRQDAEDLVQETLVRAYRNLGRVMSLESPRAWMLHVMRNLYIDQTRRSDFGSTRSVENCAPADIADEQPGPQELAEAELVSRRLEACWGRLSRDHRTLLALHDIEGYSLVELQDITGLKLGTIKSRLHRARLQLGRMMRMQGEFDASDVSARVSS